MNHYPHHIGDYLKDTSHLSLLEHGCYRRMIDVYYTREKPYQDAVEVCKLVGAKTAQERATVGSLLADYFIEEPDGWHQRRCDQEIEVYQSKAEANRENGKGGGRPKKTQTDTQNNPSGFCKPENTETQNNLNQEPIANSQEPVKKQKPRKARLVEIPPWMPMAVWGEFCEHRGKSFTDLSQIKAIATLAELRAAGNDPAAVMNRSIGSGWKGLFPLDNQRANQHGKPSIHEQRAATLAGFASKPAERDITAYSEVVD